MLDSWTLHMALTNRNLRCLLSEIKLCGVPRSLLRLQERMFPCLFLPPEAPCVPWLVAKNSNLCFHHHMAFFPVYLCAQVSLSFFFLQTPVIGFRAYSNPVRLHPNLSTFTKTLFLTMVTFIVIRGQDLNLTFGGTWFKPFQSLSSWSLQSRVKIQVSKQEITTKCYVCFHRGGKGHSQNNGKHPARLPEGLRIVLNSI